MREICDQADSGERIKCKVNNVIEQQQGVGEMMDAMNMLHEAQQQALMKEISRARSSHGRAMPMDFKQYTKKSSVDCQIQEVVGDGKGDDDGICTAGEDCLEKIGDQIGNDDGICKPLKGAKREACVEMCDAAAVNENPDNFDDDPTIDSRGRDLEQSLDDLTEQYEEVNEMMAAEMASGAAAYPFSGISPATDDVCERVVSVGPNENFRAFMRGAADGSRMAADITDKFCNQDAGGFNAAIPCAIGEGIAGVAAIISNGAEFIDDVADDDTRDAIWECLQETSGTLSDTADSVSQVGDDLMAVSNKVDDLDQKVRVLDGKVNDLAMQVMRVQEMLAEVMDLLNTPQGQRPEFTGPKQ